MNFLELLYGAEVLAQSGNPPVSGLEYDSRRVNRGDVFLAIRGETSDGNKSIDKAIAAGAVAVVSDSAAEKPRVNLAWAQVAHGRRALARLSANFYGHPAERMATTGITGTNGKSTIAFLAEAILTAAGRKSALISTIEYHVAGRVLPAPHTTPEALELNRMFAEALAQGANEAVMEVSSHALAQERVYGMPFDVAVFTNLTQDHLDYHRTMEEYFASKARLFEGCGTDAPRVAIININDPWGRELLKASRERSPDVLSYGLIDGDFHAEELQITARGSRFELITPEGTMPLFSPLIGKVNVYNVIAAAAAGFAAMCEPDDVANGIAAMSRVPGRFERVDCGQPFTVVVDYAHTDDALRNLTSIAHEFIQQAGQKGRVITVFGCGGDRDRAKRPLMGEAAGRGSDFAVLSSDNPRSEDPLAIISDALVGLQRSGVRYAVEADRRVAISLAIGEAKPGDIVLIAGKGHEKVQVTREGSLPFDDVEVARQILRQAGYDCQTTGAVVGNKA